MDINGNIDDTEKSHRKPNRNFEVNYMWPNFEKQLYAMTAQRKCTLQGDGKTKNMSENHLMREQLSQNNKKRDKRIQPGNEDFDETKVNGVKNKKKSKQNRRLQETPTENDGFGNKATENGQEKFCEATARRQLNYSLVVENNTTISVDINPSTKRNIGDLASEQIGGDIKKLKNSCDNITTTAKTGSFDIKPENEIPEEFKPGRLIWGKLKGFDWWPGIIVDFRNISSSQIQQRVNEVWVKWYGDNKYSKIAKNDLVQFRQFSSKFLPQKLRGIYKKAVISALEVAVLRCKKQFDEDEASAEKSGKDERTNLLIDWALDGFKPSGPELFEAVTEEHSVMVEPNPVDLDIQWNQNGGSGRFGQPIRTPALAEDVKAVFERVAKGVISIDDICLGCGDLDTSVSHPLFHGSLCAECKETLLESVYLFDEDGYQMYCTICGDGKEVFMCESPGCFRSYCAVCLELMCGSGTVQKISSLETWCCVMCLDNKVGLLRKRQDWQTKLRELFTADHEQEYFASTTFPTIAPEKRQPLRVLSLFDGIATGLQALKELGLDVQLYIASEIDEKATQVVQVQHGQDDFVKFVGDIEQITPEHIEAWGPFDLVIGASPCNDLSIANPGRQGIFEGSGRLFFEFFRLLMYAKPDNNKLRPFFWLFENVVSMRAVDKKTISRYLQCNPVVVDAKDISPARRARYFWGNLPGMNRPTVPLPGNLLTLQSCLEPNCGRKARFTKIQTVTTKGNSLKQTKEGILPVEVDSPCSDTSEDILWCTEMERLFGFPSHYTDVGNMGKNQRQKLLGKSWSVPVIKHLLSPLRDYFSSK